MATQVLNNDQILDLVCKAQDGNTEAFASLYDEFVDGVYRYCVFRINSEEAEDVTADVFIKAWEKLHTYKPQSGIPFRAWLFRITRHAVIDVYRSQRQTVEISENLIDTDAYNQADNAVRQQQVTAMVRKALDKLPKRYREILELSYIADLGNNEIARVLKLRLGTVRVVKHRALQSLEKELPPNISEWQTEI